jgi:hypothetical protein
MTDAWGYLVVAAISAGFYALRRRSRLRHEAAMRQHEAAFRVVR